jgi:glucose/arabinose dehydrogenase
LLTSSNTQSADQITLLRDKDHDGVAETRSTFLKNLHSPFGMALIGDDLYVASADSIVRFKYQEGATEITTPGGEDRRVPGRSHQPPLDQEYYRQ